MSHRIRNTVLLAAACFTCGCYDITEFNPPDWETNLLGPLALSDMKLEDVQQLNGLKYDVALSLQQLHLDNFPVDTAIPVPPLTINTSPVKIHFLDDFYYVTADSASVTVIIKSDLPVTITGGVIEFRNDTSRPAVLSVSIDEPIAENSTYRKNVVATNTTINSDVYMTLRNLSTAGNPNAIFYADDSVHITIQLDFIKIKRAAVIKNRTIIMKDTTDFSIKGEELNVISIEGDFTVYVNNGFPYQGDLQAYFLAEGGVFLDSLFKTTRIEAPEIDPDSGTVKMPKESKLLLHLDSVRVGRIIDSKKVYFKLNLKSADSLADTLFANNKNSIRAQLVGDLKIRIEN